MKCGLSRSPLPRLLRPVTGRGGGEQGLERGLVQGLAFANVDGAVIKNNYGSASGIFFLTGGQIEASWRPPRNIVVQGNYFTEEAWMRYSAGSGAPANWIAADSAR